MNCLKLLLLLALIFIIPIMCLGCREISRNDVIEGLVNLNETLENYQCETHITHYGFNPPVSFKLKELYKAPDILRIETLKPDNHSGNTMDFNKGIITFTHPGLNDKIEISGARIEDIYFWKFLLINRLKNLEAASDTFNMSIELINNKKYIILEIPAMAPEFLMNQERIYLDGRNLYPCKVEIRTKEGDLYICIEYKNILLNKKLEPDQVSLK